MKAKGHCRIVSEDADLSKVHSVGEPYHSTGMRMREEKERKADAREYQKENERKGKHRQGK